MNHYRVSTKDRQDSQNLNKDMFYRPPETSA